MYRSGISGRDIGNDDNEGDSQIDNVGYYRINVKEEVHEMKMRCLLDIACRLIGFDEELATHDYSSFANSDKSKPTPQDLAASDRLKNISYYYDTNIIEKLKKLLENTII